MAKTAYNIELKGYVGGAGFDRNAVDKTLAEYSGKPVNVLILCRNHRFLLRKRLRR